MGNSQSTSTTTTTQQAVVDDTSSPSVTDDLPPKFTVSEWSDRELLSRMTLFDSSTPCALIKERYEEMEQNGTARNLVSRESGSEWAQALYSLCVLSYLDRKFYNCMQRHDVNVPNDIVIEFNRLADKYSHTPINVIDASSSRVSFAAENCFDEHVNSWRELSSRMNSFTPERVNQMYSSFIQIAGSKNNNRYQIRPTDTPTQIQTSVNQLKQGACKPYIEQLPKEQNQYNYLTYETLRTEFAHCCTSHLCADQLRRCLSNGNSFVDCVYSDSIGDCISRFNRFL